MDFYYRINEKATKLLQELPFRLFKHNGLYCIVVRNMLFGTLNGYVGVTKEHPCYGKEFIDGFMKIEVHGGLGYASNTLSYIDSGILPDLWWFGFDCKHLYEGDLAAFEPVANGVVMQQREESVYRDFEFATKEVQKLADQLAKINSEKRSKWRIGLWHVKK